MPKKVKVKVRKGALDRIPEEDRAGLLEEITAIFESADPSTLGTPVRELPAEGPRVCLDCGGPLKPHGVVNLDGEMVQFFDCPACDQAFVGTPVN